MPHATHMKNHLLSVHFKSDARAHDFFKDQENIFEAKQFFTTFARKSHMKMSSRDLDALYASSSEELIESSAPSNIVGNDGKWHNACM